MGGSAERPGKIGGLGNHQLSEVQQGKVLDSAPGMGQAWMYRQAGE